MPAAPDATDKLLNRLLLVGIPVVTLALLLLVFRGTHRNQALEMQQLLRTLTARDVARVVVVPTDSAVSAGPLAATLTDQAAISQLLAAYQQAVPYGPGGGRLGNGWEAQVDFQLRTGRVIHTIAGQNNLACLLFLTPPTDDGSRGMDDYLMSQTAGHLLAQLTRPAP